MSTKQQHTNTPGVKWPKTPAAKAEEAYERQQTIGGIATMGQLMTAASAVPMPRAKHFIGEMAKEAAKGTVGKGQGAKKRERAQRDHANNYFTSNKAWDEVNEIYLSCIELLRTSVALSPLLREPRLTSKVKEHSLLVRIINAISSDTKTLVAVLSNVRKLHPNKTGGSTSPKEMELACTVYSHYVDFMERFDSILLPMIVHASELLEIAMIDLASENPELAKQLEIDLASVLNNIASAVHNTTGAADVPVMTENKKEAVPA